MDNIKIDAGDDEKPGASFIDWLGSPQTLGAMTVAAIVAATSGVGDSVLVSLQHLLGQVLAPTAVQDSPSAPTERVI
jgi:hypothetical protein